jgi:hypothetical protein
LNTVPQLEASPSEIAGIFERAAHDRFLGAVPFQGIETDLKGLILWYYHDARNAISRPHFAIRRRRATILGFVRHSRFVSFFF